MAQFLKNHGISDAIENLIRNANRKLVLISPYWKLSDSIKRTLQTKARDGLLVQAVYRDEQQRPEDIDWLERQQIQAMSLTNLHAKCYMNESQCIVTSLNLYERDQVHNLEMGILIDRKENSALFAEVAKEVNSIVSLAKPQPPSARQMMPVNVGSGKLSESQLAKHLGTDETGLKKRLAELGHLKLVKHSYELTEQGQAAGGAWQPTPNGGRYRVWPTDINLLGL